MSLGHISRFAAADIRAGDIVHRTTGDVHHSGPVCARYVTPGSVRLTYDCTVCPGEHVISVLPGDGVTAERTPR